MDDKPLCADARDDGLYVGASQYWPHCIGAPSCTDDKGCFWRRWHQIPSDAMRRETPTPQLDIFT